VELESILQAAHTVWGRLFETHAAEKLGDRYSPVLDSFSVDVGKKGQIDFLAVADGYEAWEGFAKDHMTRMHNSTRATLHGPHFLIAEIGLTTQTLINKFKDNATSLRLMHTFVSTMRSNNFSAVKCLVYDGADAEDFSKSKIARQFLDEGGILINIPYLSAETVLAKLNETTKLREEILAKSTETAKLREELQALREDLKLSGTTAALTKAVWVRQLQKEDGEIKEADTDPFQVKSDLSNVDDLKKAIRKEKPNRVKCDADEIEVRSLKDGRWEKENADAEINRGTSMSDCYGFLLPD